MQILSRKFDNNKSITRNITAILKKFITKDVALMFNAQKKVLGKYLFKDTYFCNCLQGKIFEKKHF